jgi:hypothetical protein
MMDDFMPHDLQSLFDWLDERARQLFPEEWPPAVADEKRPVPGDPTSGNPISLDEARSKKRGGRTKIVSDLAGEEQSLFNELCGDEDPVVYRELFEGNQFGGGYPLPRSREEMMKIRAEVGATIAGWLSPEHQAEALGGLHLGIDDPPLLRQQLLATQMETDEQLLRNRRDPQCRAALIRDAMRRSREQRRASKVEELRWRAFKHHRQQLYEGVPETIMVSTGGERLIIKETWGGDQAMAIVQSGQFNGRDILVRRGTHLLSFSLPPGLCAEDGLVS